MMWPTDYDQQLDAGHEPCERCGALDCGEECVAAYDLYRKRPEAAIRWLYVACRMSMLRARSYRTEEGQQGQRERQALAAVRSYRNDIRAIRAGETHAKAAE